MNSDIPNSKPSGLEKLQGKASKAFQVAAEGKIPARTEGQTQRGSQMIKNTAFGLHGGPTPPGLTRSAVTRQSFNQRWREEGRGFRALRWKLREEFNLKAGAIRNAVVKSDTRPKTPLLKSDFNQAAQVTRRRSR